MLSVVFLGTIGETPSAGWSLIGVPGSEFSIPAPEFVQCASMQLLNNFPDIVVAAKTIITRLKPLTGGDSSEDRFATGIGAALSPFIAQQQHTLEILAKNASIGSAAKEYDRSRLASLQGIVDNPNQFFALFSPPSSLEGVNGDAGVGDGGDGGTDGVPAQVPSAKQIDRHSFFVAIRSKLASTTGITQRPFDLSDKALWDLFGILDFGPGGNADICQFVRKGESVSSPQELQAALENYASFIQLLGFASLGKAIFNLRRAIVTLAGQNPRAGSLAVQLQISKNQLSLPFGKHAGRFAPGSIHTVSLEDSLSSTFCDLTTNEIITLLMCSPLPSDRLPRDPRGGRGNGRDLNNNKRKNSNPPEPLAKKQQKPGDPFPVYLEEFKKGIPACVGGPDSTICRSWASNRGRCNGKARCSHPGLVHGYPEAVKNDPNLLKICQDYFGTWNPPPK